MPSLLDQLVEGVLLPLAQLGQSFPTSDSYVIALANWRVDGFPGLNARKAAALLGTAAANKGWVYAQMMRMASRAAQDRHMLTTHRCDPLHAYPYPSGPLKTCAYVAQRVKCSSRCRPGCVRLLVINAPLLLMYPRGSVLRIFDRKPGVHLHPCARLSLLPCCRI